jgi:hypothetical protein
MAAAHGHAFETGPQKWEYELASTDVSLPAGSYAAYLHGNVLFGGLDLGVLDGNTNKWLNQTLFWFRQVGYGKGWMAAQFRLAAPTPIQVILSNWIPSPRSSRWSLDELKLVRLGR